jgi:ATP-binding cassette, subfamily B, multidrug efflux pump
LPFPLLGVAVPVMAVVIGAMLVLVVQEFRSMQTKIDRINQGLREQITGVRVIRAFVRGQSEGRRFADANASLTATALRVNRIFALALPALMAILNPVQRGARRARLTRVDPVFRDRQRLTGDFRPWKPAP